MRISRWLTTAAALLGFLAASQETRAVVILTALPPGTTTQISLAGPSTTLPTGSLLYGATVLYSTPTFSATVREAVISDATNPGKLDFIYQVTNTSSGVGLQNDNISELSTTPFSFVNIQSTGSGFGAGYGQTGTTYTGPGGSITFVNTSTGPGNTPAGAPNVSRPNTTGADTINFFRNPSTPLPPGAVGNILFLQTNAMAFSLTGFVSLIDGTSQTLAGPIPAAVPEPATVALAFSGLPLLGFVAWRRRRTSSRA